MLYDDRHDSDNFWHDDDEKRDPIWPFIVIGAALAAILWVGIFVA